MEANLSKAIQDTAKRFCRSRGENFRRAHGRDGVQSGAAGMHTCGGGVAGQTGMMGNQCQVWRPLNASLIILDCHRKEKGDIVQWGVEKLGMWRQLLRVNAAFNGKRGMREGYRWSGVKYQELCLVWVLQNQTLIQEFGHQQCQEVILRNEDGKRHIKQEGEGGNAGCTDEQVVTTDTPTVVPLER